VSEPAARLLGQFGADAAPAVPALTEALLLRLAAFQNRDALGKIGPGASSAVPRILEHLNDLKGYGRAILLEELGALGPHARAAVPALIRMLREGTEPTDYVVAALGRIGPEAKEALPLLWTLLGDARGDLRVELHGALALITGDHPSHVKALIKIYKDLPPCWHRSRSDRHQKVLAALGRMGPSARAAVPLLIELVKDRGWSKYQLRCSAIKALGQMGEASRDAVPHLLPCLTELFTLDLPLVIEALGNVGPSAAAAIPLLEEHARDHNPSIRAAALQALAKIRNVEPPR
jgi:HEAT repeat protein